MHRQLTSRERAILDAIAAAPDGVTSDTLEIAFGYGGIRKLHGLVKRGLVNRETNRAGVVYTLAADGARVLFPLGMGGLWLAARALRPTAPAEARTHASEEPAP